VSNNVSQDNQDDPSASDSFYLSKNADPDVSPAGCHRFWLLNALYSLTLILFLCPNVSMWQDLIKKYVSVFIQALNCMLATVIGTKSSLS